ncbi:MAG: hypothetical protein E6447_13810, partial [Bradyrhizobium sp.]|nr:hypothetical protein [Bradyrhizobium sp.]
GRREKGREEKEGLNWRPSAIGWSEQDRSRAIDARAGARGGARSARRQKSLCCQTDGYEAR